MLEENLVESYTIDEKFIVKIGYDSFPESPRDWDNMTEMLCFHHRYNLGDTNPYDKNDFNSWREFQEHLEAENDIAIICPLYLYDHSGISISFRTFIGKAPHAEWDSGQVGFVFITKDKLKAEGLSELIGNEALENYIKAEVETYDSYVRGEVYEYAVYTNDEDEELLDSCSGYYSIEDIKKDINVDYLMSEYIRLKTPKNQLTLQFEN